MQIVLGHLLEFPERQIYSVAHQSFLKCEKRTSKSACMARNTPLKMTNYCSRMRLCEAISLTKNAMNFISAGYEFNQHMQHTSTSNKVQKSLLCGIRSVRRQHKQHGRRKTEPGPGMNAVAAKISITVMIETFVVVEVGWLCISTIYWQECTSFRQTRYRALCLQPCGRLNQPLVLAAFLPISIAYSYLRNHLRHISYAEKWLPLSSGELSGEPSHELVLTGIRELLNTMTSQGNLCEVKLHAETGSRAETRFLDSLKVFLESIRKPQLQRTPFENSDACRKVVVKMENRSQCILRRSTSCSFLIEHSHFSTHPDGTNWTSPACSQMRKHDDFYSLPCLFTAVQCCVQVPQLAISG